jgi:hypothetical protein
VRRRVIEALWIDAPPPAEYVRLVLCRDVYHCPPTALDDVPLRVILEDLAMISAERDVRRALERSRAR